MAAFTAHHLYCTMRLVAKTGTTWAGEVALMGWHIGAVAAGNALPALNAGTITMESFEVDDAATTSTTAHFNKVQGWTGHTSGTQPIVTDGDQDGIAEAVWDYFSAVQTYIPSDYALGDVRLYPQGDAGKMLTAGPVIYTPSSVPSGTSGGVLIPQVAVCTSTNATTAGRKGRGRWYLGPVATNAGTSQGILSSTARDVFGNAGTALFDAWRAIGSIASSRYYPVIWHKGTALGSVVDHIRVGDEFDTQQRRRRQRAEVYQTYTL